MGGVCVKGCSNGLAASNLLDVSLKELELRLQAYQLLCLLLPGSNENKLSI